MRLLFRAVFHDVTDDSPHNHGRIGFALWHSIIVVDFIEIYQLREG